MPHLFLMKPRAVRAVFVLSLIVGFSSKGDMSAAVSSVVSTRPQLAITEQRLAAHGRTFDVKVVRTPLAAYGVKIGLAGGRVGMTAPVADIASRYRAVAAINGCFFDAYTRATIKPPYHHLITGGDLVHIGNTGTTLDFSRAGDVRMDRLRISLLGGLDGQWTHPANWYAYFVNHPLTSTSAATLYTSHWAASNRTVSRVVVDPHLHLRPFPTVHRVIERCIPRR